MYRLIVLLLALAIGLACIAFIAQADPSHRIGLGPPSLLGAGATYASSYYASGP